MMDEQTSKALQNLETWLRLPVMALFFAMLLIATPLLIMLALYAWIVLLLKGSMPDSAVGQGKAFGAWFDRTSRYLTGAAERRPFPFEDLDCPRDPPPGSRTASPTTKAVQKSRSAPPAVPESPAAQAGAGGQPQQADPSDGTADEAPTPPAAVEGSEAKGVKKKAGSVGKKAAGKTAAAKTVKKSPAKKATRKKTTKKKTAAKKASRKPSDQAGAEAEQPPQDTPPAEVSNAEAESDTPKS